MLGVGRFCCMQTDGNEMQVREGLGDRGETAVTG